MTRYIKRLCVTFSMIAMLAACASVPQDIVLPDDVFQAKLAEARSATPAYSGLVLYSEMIESGGLSAEQRGQVLFERGQLRRTSGTDTILAITDFDEIIALEPPHRLSDNAKAERQLAMSEIRRIEALRNSGQMQTLAGWFDDAWKMGEQAEAAGRYQRAGLSPTPRQVERLRAAGYICSADGEGEPVYQFGSRRPDLSDLRWCNVL